MKILEVTLKIEQANFCMRKGDTIQFKDGAFKRKEIEQPFYPIFGPYSLINQIGDHIVAGIANSEEHKMFSAKEVEV